MAERDASALVRAAPLVHLATRGCRVNQYEAESLLEAWDADGACATDDPAAADVVVALTCAVTARAVASLRRELPRLVRASPGARRLLAGCAVQALPGELKAAAAGWELVPRSGKAGLLRLFSPARADDLQGDPATSGGYPPFSLRMGRQARALCKIQDGCAQACAYCIVPRARGGPVSRPEDETLAEALRLAAHGAREIVLTGVNLGQYGRDLSPPATLWSTLRRLEASLASLPEPPRLRLSSLDPGLLDDEALACLAESRLVCPHLHLSLQSGSPAVLAAMGRTHYQPGRVAAWLERLRRRLPLFALGADFLVGFPGETEEDFQMSRVLLESLPFSYAHVFPFSPRPGTRAAAMSGQVPVPRRLERAALLREVAARKAEAFAQALLRLPRLEAVLETLDGTAGMCEYFLACRLDAPAPGVARRQRLPVRPLGLDGDAGRLLVRPV